MDGITRAELEATYARRRLHGSTDAYDDAAIAGDLGAVLDDRGTDRAMLAGASMGAHTLLRFALAHPDRVDSRDDADPEHPLATGERYVAEIAGAQQRTEDEGSSPLAWQGGQLSKVIAETAVRVP